MTLESRIMKDARSGKPCIACGVTDGTVCGRHYNGQRQHFYGKGRGIKGHCFAVADLCSTCEVFCTEGSVSKQDYVARDVQSEVFQHWCIMSLIRREKEGFFD